MKPALTCLMAWLGSFASPLCASEPATTAAPPGKAWVRSLTDRGERGTLQDEFQYVRGDSGKWNDDPILQLAPPLARKPAQLRLDDWADQLLEQDVKLRPGDETWLLLRTRQLDDNDRVWIDRIERRGARFTIVVNEAIWQGRYQKTFTYYSTFGINLGKLDAGRYTVTVLMQPLTFQRFDGDGRPRENWPQDERPAEKMAVELRQAFDVAF